MAALFESAVGRIEDLSSSSGLKMRNPEMRMSRGERNKRFKNAAEKQKPGPKPKVVEKPKKVPAAKRTNGNFLKRVSSSDPSTVGSMVHPEDSSQSMISRRAFDASPETINFFPTKLI